MRGEKFFQRGRERKIPGSPPRARGKARADRARRANQGITPACAGKSLPGGAGGGQLWDHPRVRGEKDSDVLAELAEAGSPPRARGKGGQGARLAGGAGITPACAGKSQSILRTRYLFRDHPRVRGEKVSPGDMAAKNLGSPPRARGKGA